MSLPAHISVRVAADVLDPSTELAALPPAGAVASFTGHVRADDGVTCLTLEHYPGATERALEGLAQEAAARWPLQAVRVVHRVGPMTPGEAVVFVGTASAHRAAALEACAFLIDRLKTDAPFWKQEQVDGGATRWVEPRDSDDAAAERWVNGPR